MRDHPLGESLNKLSEWKKLYNSAIKQRKIINNIIRQKRIHSSKQSVASDKVIN